MKHLGIYSNKTDIQAAIDLNQLVKPYVALYNNGNVDFNSLTITDYSKEYLTFKILSDGDIVWYNPSSKSYHHKTIQYSKNNGGTWQNAELKSNQTFSIPVVSGDIILFKGTNDAYCASDGSYWHTFKSTCQFEAYGNILSLIYGDNFINQTTFPNNSSYNFRLLWRDCTRLISVKNLILPATSLTETCYSAMFSGCTSLTTAPELPATTLASNCYQQMFSGCSNLNYIKCLATDISANFCTSNWVSGVAANGTFIKNPNMNSWTSSNNGIPEGWTVQDAS